MDFYQQMSDPQAEQAVVGAILIDPDAVEKVIGDLKPEMFEHQDNGLIYECQIQLWEQGQPIDYMTLSDELNHRQASHLNIYLMELVNVTPSALHVEHYARIVIKKYQTRRLIQMSMKVVEMVDEGALPDAILAYGQQEMAQINNVVASHGLMDWGQSFHYTTEMLDRYHRAATETLESFKTPWPSWNQYLGQGLYPGGLMIVAAPTSTGKSVVAECLADCWTMEGQRVGFAHFELNPELMMSRRLCRWATVSLSQVKTNQPEDAAIERMVRAQERWYKCPGSIDYLHCGGYAMADIVRQAELQKWDALIVDYLQMAVPSAAQRKERLNNEALLAQNCALLKNWAEKHGTRVVLLSQLNRNFHTFEEINENSLRGSGQIAEKSALVAILYRQTLDVPVVDQRTKQVIAQAGEKSPFLQVKIVKNTLGRTTDSIRQQIHGPHFRILDL